MWGRLDAVAHVVKLVVAESELIPEAEKASLVLEWQTRLQEAVLRREEQPSLAAWVAAAAEFADRGGATNDMVMDALHETGQGQELLREGFDEALSLSQRGF